MRFLDVSAALLALALAGCPHNPGGDAGADARPTPRCPSTVLPDCTAAGGDLYSDEACAALDDYERASPPVVDATRGPVIDAPTEGAVLPSATPATFRWTGRFARVDRAAPRLALRPRPAPRAMTFRDELARWTTLVPEAHAHCMPYNGLGYALAFRAGGRTILRVEQSRTEYTPDAAAWATLRGAGGPIELTISVARFRSSQVEMGSYASPTRTFTIAP